MAYEGFNKGGDDIRGGISVMDKEFGKDVDNVEVELGHTKALGNIWKECDVCQI